MSQSQPQPRSHHTTTAMRAAPRLTPEERAALGKEARRRSPRSGHAVYEPSPAAPTRWRSWRRSPRPGCPSSYRSATAG